MSLLSCREVLQAQSSIYRCVKKQKGGTAAAQFKKQSDNIFYQALHW